MPVIVQQHRKRALRVQLKRTDDYSCFMFLICIALIAAPVVSALLSLKASTIYNDNSDFTYYIIQGKLLTVLFLMHSNDKCDQHNRSNLV